MDVKTRLVNYYNDNLFIQKYIKGMNLNTNEIVLFYNGLEKRISIDDLEKISNETEVISFLNNNTFLREEKEETLAVDMVEPKVVSSELDKETLNDIKILTEIKSKSGLDNVLKKFAINESNGLIDINKAINIVEKNTIEEVVKSIKEKYDFDLDLNKYDTTGKYFGETVSSNVSDEEKIVSSFNNIKVYLEAANMYVEQAHFSEEDINRRMKEYIDKVKNLLHPVEVVKQQAPIVTEPENVKSAGFADIFVLCFIVGVYAIIIINLILKLS